MVCRTKKWPKGRELTLGISPANHCEFTMRGKIERWNIRCSKLFWGTTKLILNHVMIELNLFTHRAELTNDQVSIGWWVWSMWAVLLEWSQGFWLASTVKAASILSLGTGNYERKKNLTEPRWTLSKCLQTDLTLPIPDAMLLCLFDVSTYGVSAPQRTCSGSANCKQFYFLVLWKLVLWWSKMIQTYPNWVRWKHSKIAFVKIWVGGNNWPDNSPRPCLEMVWLPPGYKRPPAAPVGVGCWRRLWRPCLMWRAWRHFWTSASCCVLEKMDVLFSPGTDLSRIYPMIYYIFCWWYYQNNICVVQVWWEKHQLIESISINPQAWNIFLPDNKPAVNSTQPHHSLVNLIV